MKLNQERSSTDDDSAMERLTLRSTFSHPVLTEMIQGRLDDHERASLLEPFGQVGRWYEGERHESAARKQA